jgi:hypothetical protein
MVVEAKPNRTDRSVGTYCFRSKHFTIQLEWQYELDKA